MPPRTPLTTESIVRAIRKDAGKAILYQRDIAEMYAEAIRHRDPVDWPTINKAILLRWPRGLLKVKKMAWKMLETPVH